MFMTVRAYPVWGEAFLVALAPHGLIASAAKAVKVTSAQVQAYREYNKEFGEHVKEVLEESKDALEKEAFRRAVEGVEEDVYYKGEIVGTVRRYSDSLLSKMLEAKRKEEYGTTKVQVDTAVTVLIRDFALQPSGAVVDAEFTPVPLIPSTTSSLSVEACPYV